MIRTTLVILTLTFSAYPANAHDARLTSKHGLGQYTHSFYLIRYPSNDEDIKEIELIVYFQRGVEVYNLGKNSIDVTTIMDKNNSGELYSYINGTTDREKGT